MEKEDMDMKGHECVAAIKVSIIVPVYNVSKYIRRCMESVLSQSYPSIECILVDDCTPDSSMEICRTMIVEADTHIDFVMLRHERNRGLSAARNTGLKQATGDYVLFLDSDDELSSDAVELLVSKAKEYNGVEMVIGNRESARKDLMDICFYASQGLIEGNERVRRAFFCLDHHLPVEAWNKLVSRSFLVRNDLRFEEGLIHEDELWTFLVACRLNSMACLPEKTYVYYSNPESIMNVESACERVHAMNIILGRIVDMIEEPESRLQLCYYLMNYLTLYKQAYECGAHEYLMVGHKFEKRLRVMPVLMFLVFLHRVTYPLIHGKYITWMLYKSIGIYANR